MSVKKGDVKRLVFYDTTHRHVELKIRLDHDDMTQSEFFRALITGYLSKDDLIMEYFNNYRLQHSIQSKTKVYNSQKLINEGKQTKDKFLLNENEKDNIFDMIAEEHPDL